MRPKFKFRWPWLLLIVVPLWLAAAVGELMDTRLLETEGVPAWGRMESAKWVAGRRGGRTLAFDAVWEHAGREYRQSFSVSSAVAEQYVTRDGQVLETKLELRYAPSKPELVSIAIQPRDPLWVSIIIACVGLAALIGVIAFLIYDWRQRK